MQQNSLKSVYYSECKTKSELTYFFEVHFLLNHFISLKSFDKMKV